jgi:hypothetical protein
LQFRTKSPGAIPVSDNTSSGGFPSAHWNTGVANQLRLSAQLDVMGVLRPPDPMPQPSELPEPVRRLGGRHVGSAQDALAIGTLRGVPGLYGESVKRGRRSGLEGDG